MFSLRRRTNRDVGRTTNMTPAQTTDPFSLWNLRDEMDRLFDQAFRGWMAPPWESAASFVPSVNVRELDDRFEVTAELPGISPEQIDVSLEQDTLVLRGEKRQEHEQNTGQMRHIERSWGSFERRIPFGAEVDQDKIEARFRDGVLTIDVPKSVDAQIQRKRIEVQT